MHSKSQPQRAAQYLRMSTDRQESSIGHQRATIAAYAMAHGYDISRTYIDEGISGLLIEERSGLKSLLADVLSGGPDFDVILVYDVSRWGRFQNPDQAAHYEFICVEAGVRVEYCAEMFANDGSLTAMVLKSLKRVMAAEYSRELSAKVVLAKDRLGAAGFWQGGQPGYGLRRQQILSDGSSGRVMERGDSKGPNNGRTRLVPGPPDEVAVIRSIFRMFVRERQGLTAIVDRLNKDGMHREAGQRWNTHYVQHVLTSPRYAGVNVVGRTQRRMKSKTREYRPREGWLYVEGAFEPLVDRRVFDAAQALFLSRRTPLTERQMLDGLTRLCQRHGRLSTALINAAPEVPHSSRYIRKFGSMAVAYERIGYKLSARQKALSEALVARRRKSALPGIEALGAEGVIRHLRELLAKHGRLSLEIVNDSLGTGAYQQAATKFGGGRRLYALAGYRPNKRQAAMFDRSWDQSLTEQEAEALRMRVVSGDHVPLTW